MGLYHPKINLYLGLQMVRKVEILHRIHYLLGSRVSVILKCGLNRILKEILQCDSFADRGYAKGRDTKVRNK